MTRVLLHVLMAGPAGNRDILRKGETAGGPLHAHRLELSGAKICEPPAIMCRLGSLTRSSAFLGYGW